mgnify:CR=1 FL=1
MLAQIANREKGHCFEIRTVDGTRVRLYCSCEADWVNDNTVALVITIDRFCDSVQILVPDKGSFLVPRSSLTEIT